jgi:tRNA uridine 5-carboxymethylaminomethyl modification enzyme
VWIEPEGLDSDVAYPNGITMGFPEDIQREVVASIPGWILNPKP